MASPSMTAGLKEREEQLDSWESKLVAKQEDLNVTLRDFRSEMAQAIAQLKDTAAQLCAKEIDLQRREKEVAEREQELLSSMRKFRAKISGESIVEEPEVPSTTSKVKHVDPPNVQPPSPHSAAASAPISPGASPSKNYEGRLDVNAKQVRSQVEELSDDSDKAEEVSPQRGGGGKKVVEARAVRKDEVPKPRGSDEDWDDDDDDDEEDDIVFQLGLDARNQQYASDSKDQQPFNFALPDDVPEDIRAAFPEALQVFMEASNISPAHISEMLNVGALTPEQIIGFVSGGVEDEGMFFEEEGTPENLADNKERIDDESSSSSSSGEEKNPRGKHAK